MQKSNQSQEIYWEKQEHTRLCGLHCINSLLQGPYLSESDMRKITLDMDQAEQKLLGKNSNASDNMRAINQNQSENGAMDGQFSIQVLIAALKSVSKTIVVNNIEAQTNRHEEYTRQTGFICNSGDHWFAVRKVGQKFYNLNSMFKNGPETLGDVYLGAFLQQQRYAGYTILNVQGDFPTKDKWMFTNTKQMMLPYQKWFRQDQLQTVDNSDNAQQVDVTDQKKEVKLFDGQGVTLNSNSQQNNQFQSLPIDRDFEKAIKDSLAEKYVTQPKEGINVTFRMPEGKKEQWTFDPNQLVSELYEFVRFKQPIGQTYNFIIMENFPKKEYTNENLPIAESGLENKTAVIVSKK